MRHLVLFSALLLGALSAEAQISLSAYRDSVAGYDWRVKNAAVEADRNYEIMRQEIVTAIFATIVAVLMPMIYFLTPYKIPSLVFTFLAPALLFGIGGPLQYLIVRYAKGGEMLGGAGIQIAFNVSNAVAAAVGGAEIGRAHV